MVKYDSFTRGLTVAQKILGLFHLKWLILLQIQLYFNRNVRQFTATATTVTCIHVLLAAIRGVRSNQSNPLATGLQILLKITGQFPILTISRRSLSLSFWPEFNSITTYANFNQFQSAYRPQHSTETALLYTLNNIYSSAYRSQPTLLVSLDLLATGSLTVLAFPALY